MATEEQQQQLIDTLKFTPRTYTISCWGYGGEIAMGKIDRKAYDYFIDNDIDLNEYVWDSDNEAGVPEDCQPFYPGEWYECDNMAHESGVEMSNYCQVAVYDENNDEIWTHSLDVSDLEESEIGVNCFDEVTTDDLEPGTAVFVGQSIEKGTFYGGEFELTEPFDPKKLSITYCNINGWPLMSNVMYGDQDIDNNDYSTTGKSSEFEFILVE